MRKKHTWKIVLFFFLIFASSFGQIIEELYRNGYDNSGGYALLVALLNTLVVSCIMMAVPFVCKIVNRELLVFKTGKKICLWNSIILFIVSCVLTAEFDVGIIGGVGAVLFYFMNIWIFVEPDSSEVKTNNDEKGGAAMSLSFENEKTHDNGVALNDMHFEANNERIPYESGFLVDMADDNAKRGVNKKFVVIFLSTLAALILIVLLLVFLIIPSVKYSNAKSLLENGNYESAYFEFEKLDGYSDSEDMMLECRYLQAIKYRNAGDYEVANKIFESLGNYRDSKILIHNHDYRVVSRTESTCTTAGSETLECSGCKQSQTNYLEAAHKYVNVKTIQATCESEGSKTFECSVCHDTYSATLAAREHDYYSATCTKPKTCAICGHAEGEALGHITGNIKCSRCGEIAFETLTYSGVGSKVIDYSLPNGKFKVVVTMTSGNGSVDVKMHYTESYRDTYEWFFITDKGNSEMEYVNGPISGTIVVNASDSYLGNSGWKIEITAVSN